MARDTIIDRFQRNAEKLGRSPALFAQEGDQWRPISWQAYWERCLEFAGSLMRMGYEPGEAVCIMGNNCAEWVIADVAAIMVRGVPAGVYQTNTVEQTAYIVNHCEARVLVLEKRELWDRLKDHLDQFPRLEQVVMIHEADAIKHELVCSFDAFLEQGKAHKDAVLKRISEIQDDDLATLIYTSGTTGPPKGVMLSNSNLAFTAKAAADLIGGITQEDTAVSYLPLSHIAEQMFTIHLPLTGGAKVYFCDDLKKIKDALVIARPTFFLGVPRVWEKFKSALETRFAEATGAKAKIVAWSRGVGLRDGLKYLEDGPKAHGFQYKIANKLFFSKLREGLGLDKLRVAVVSAAPIGRDVMEFFLSCGIPIYEVYGQSEGSGPTTFNRPKPGWTRFSTVGRPFPGADVKIAEDGEILVKGPNVFMGYYKSEDATAKTLIDGWLYTGDVGEFDAEGFLRITDRKKDLIITAGGKNVAPQNIEKLLRKIEGVSQAVVIGDNRKFLSAVLTLDVERLPDLAPKMGWPSDPEVLAKDAAFLKHVQAGVDAANEELARYENIRKFVVLPLDFSIDGGELTPTQKIKRKVVNDKYAAQIEAMYAGGGGD